MKHRQIELLIAKRLSEELAPDEEREFNSWLNANSHNIEEYRKIALTYQLSGSGINTQRKQVVFNRVKHRIEAERCRETELIKDRHTYNFRWIAAALVIVLISVGTLFHFSKSMESPLEQVVPMTKKANPSGQKSKIFLPDGSIAWLNSESFLLYESDFNDSIRYVEMDGEAYFEVKKDPSRPFVVRSRQLSVTALGTAFNVNTFRGEDEVHVALTEGVVSIATEAASSDQAEVILNAGEEVIYAPERGGMLSVVKIDTESVKLWKDGILLLNDISFEETIELLSRWYGVQFEITNEPSRAWNAQGIFDNEYLDNVLNTLSFSQGFYYEINGKTILLTFKKNT